MLWCSTLEPTEAPAAHLRTTTTVTRIESWLGLHASENVVLGLLLLLLCGSCKQIVLHLLWVVVVLLLATTRIKSSLPLAATSHIVLHLLLWHASELPSRLVSLLLLLECAVEELWLEATAGLSRLLWLASKWIVWLLLLLLLLLLLEHLHLLHLRLALLLLLVPITHDFKSGVLRVRWISLRVLLHHLHDIIYHVLLLVWLLGWLLHCSGLSWCTDEVPKAIILVLSGAGRDKVTKLIILLSSRSHADKIRCWLLRRRGLRLLYGGCSSDIPL